MPFICRYTSPANLFQFCKASGTLELGQQASLSYRPRYRSSSGQTLLPMGQEPLLLLQILSRPLQPYPNSEYQNGKNNQQTQLQPRLYQEQQVQELLQHAPCQASQLS